MTDPAFPPHIAAALDRLTVPPLPHGFGDRLAARITAGDLPVESSSITPPLAPARRRLGSAGWRRSGGLSRWSPLSVSPPQPPPHQDFSESRSMSPL
jgi:hypothetical protein